MRNENEREEYVSVYDINPHFLFNALNSIKCSAILGESFTANRIDDLSTYMRFVMKYSGKKELVSVQEIMKFVSAYGRLEEMRFEKLTVQYDLKRTDFRMPAFLLVEAVDKRIHENILPFCSEGILRICIDDDKNVTIEIVQEGNVEIYEVLERKEQDENHCS